MSNTPTHGSDVQETPDWWKASDGRFYPPELHPDYVKPEAPAAAVPDDASGDSVARARDTLGNEAGAVGSPDPAPDTAPDPAPAYSFDSGSDSASDSDADDPRATLAQYPESEPLPQQTIIQRPDMPLGSATMPPSPMPPSPGAPPPMPSQMPSPGAPPMPSSPGAPPMPLSPMPPSPGAPPMPLSPMPPSPGAPPPMPSQMPSPGAPPMPPSPSAPPPSPGAPPPMPSGMPPAPGMSPSPPAPAPHIEHGPSGITFTAPVETSRPSAQEMAASSPAAFQPPALTVRTKVSSSVSGLIALIGGAAAIAGSLLQWGKGSVVGSNGIEKAVIEVAGFDSNGLITAICGGVLILAGILFFLGVPKQLNWAILAFLGGAVIVGAAVFSLIDIGDLSNRYAAQWQSEGLATVGDVISTQADIGLWIAGAGGVLGVLAAPFANRS